MYNFPWKFISTNQAQKEYFINYNFSLLDFLLYPKINSFVDDLPEKPENGDAYIMNQNNQIAYFQNGFHFINPYPNMKVFHEGDTYIFNDGKFRREND